ncbi:hypothetical protein ACFQ08_32500 [Streptosporangium algeriense]|uniref:Transposase IS701-like DDE domain-containing protein n=1 Tax=Streptosporangium algeriense TaxID=1682748 RepID=A0ABW3E2W5_9ACTN
MDETAGGSDKVGQDYAHAFGYGKHIGLSERPADDVTIAQPQSVHPDPDAHHHPAGDTQPHPQHDPHNRRHE